MSRFIQFLVIWLTPPIHPCTYQTIHPLMCGGVSTDFTSSKRIKLSWLVEVLLNFYWFQGSPRRLGWMDWGRCGCQCVGGTPCRHAYACMYMHVKHDKHGYLHEGGHLQFLYMCMCACACMYVHVHMSVDTPHAPRCTPIICSLPKSRREAKTPKFNKSWTNWDNLIPFEDSLPLNTPELI